LLKFMQVNFEDLLNLKEKIILRTIAAF
jgi:hypothetical protein